MKTKSNSKTRFNMIELVLSVAILAVCVIGIAALFLVGMKNNVSSISENSAAQTSHNMYSYITQNALSLGSSAEWQEYFASIPNNKSTNITEIQGNVTFAQAPEFGNIYKIGETENEQNNNAASGIYGITFKTGENQDVRGVAQVWKTDGTQNGDFLEKIYFNESEINSENLEKIKENAVAVNMEISFPVEKPYAQREKKQYYFELMNEFNQDASQNFSVTVNSNEFTAEELNGGGSGNNPNTPTNPGEESDPTVSDVAVPKLAFCLFLAPQSGGNNGYYVSYFNFQFNVKKIKEIFGANSLTNKSLSFVLTMDYSLKLGVSDSSSKTVYPCLWNTSTKTEITKNFSITGLDVNKTYAVNTSYDQSSPYPGVRFETIGDTLTEKENYTSGNGKFSNFTITKLTLKISDGANSKTLNLVDSANPLLIVNGFINNQSLISDTKNEYIFIKMYPNENNKVTSNNLVINTVRAYENTDEIVEEQRKKVMTAWVQDAN